MFECYRVFNPSKVVIPSLENLDALGLQADQRSIDLKTLLLAIHADSLIQGRVITSSLGISAEDSRGAVSTCPRLNIGGERLDGEILDVDTGSSIGVSGINACGIAAGIVISSIADGWVCGGSGHHDRGKNNSL